MLKYALLGLLNYASMSGYELKQNMDVSTSNFWNAKLSQIYTALKSLEEEGWVTSTIHPQEDKPDKRVYTITDEGKRNLQSWLAEPEIEQSQQKHVFLLKLFFAAQLDKEQVLTQLRLQKTLRQRQFDLHQNETRSVI